LHFIGQRKEGLRWIPRHSETTKGADTGDTLRGAGNKHGSEDTRIGQPLQSRTPFWIHRKGRGNPVNWNI